MPGLVEGMVSLRGTRVPVVNSAKYANIGIESPREIIPVFIGKPFITATLSEKLEKISEKIKKQAVAYAQTEAESWP